MRRKNLDPTSSGAPGQDSFLDVICNLVGILIIMVTVVSARTQGAATEAAIAKAEELVTPSVSMADLQAAASAVKDIERNVFEIESQRKRVEQEAQLRAVHRDKVLLLKTAMEREMTLARAGLDESARADFDLRRQLDDARRAFEDLSQVRQNLKEADPAPQVLRHYPTPMAKTVFGREEHFQLLGGKIVYVPLNDLVEELKSEAPQKVWKLKDSTQTTETIGPLQDFRMRYTLKKSEVEVQTKIGVAMRDSIQLDNFVLIPVTENLGETLDQAMLAGSKFRFKLDKMPPRATTLTVWTYPDSFPQFRQLREQLIGLGYTVAARPLPAGHPIGGSPSGSRSSAE